MNGCRVPTEVEIDETRELNSNDERIRLHASNWQRFKPGERHYVYKVPKEWVRRRNTQMRQVNLGFGPNGEGDVYISETRGSLWQNVNRWRRQFGLEPISETDVNSLPRATALGVELALVEEKGTYGPGMGKAAKNDYGLLGVIGATGSGVITIKMVGPGAIVEAERERFLEFCRGLNLGD
ncbi:MAG: hypothetical protein CMN05_00700 [Roseibacillus sp.]|jgi:hypothetical protein|nr:hypothetical protein [Roseibacillus sp.]MBP35723.1 hypothetical protein [Roseibacillus sp.]MBP35920.1 hypothetical protein [Roseibacillus sp.]MCP4728883.1 hypothetical protein [Roseibacillus sp.]MDP7307468.1 hypothetical protein [Roseibacillus sp.]|tara:strand:- start:31777 stop:32319 length:543 start_codon:yes stop_codon:yes gene_type:complete